MAGRGVLTMRVLLTNNTLADRAGTELYVRDVALRLRELGHEPVAWSPVLGTVAAEMRQLGIPVVDDLAQLPFQPDIIHGHHHLETMTALLCLPGVPAIFFCHGAKAWEEKPPLSPRILRHVAVDLPCLERVVQDTGIAAEKVVTLLNFVDLKRFQPRAPLPDKPRRALMLSNYPCPGSVLRTIRKACAQQGISLDTIGLPYRNATDFPEKIFPQYDLVFAKGRTALEAMAVGCAVIVWHGERCGPLVTAGELDRLRSLNFGFRVADQPVTPVHLTDQIARYSAADAAAVSRMVRAQVDMHGTIDQLVRLYEAVLAESKKRPVDIAEELRAAGRYWQTLLPIIKHAPKQITHTPKYARNIVLEKMARRADWLGRWLRS